MDNRHKLTLDPRRSKILSHTLHEKNDGDSFEIC